MHSSSSSLSLPRSSDKSDNGKRLASAGSLSSGHIATNAQNAPKTRFCLFPLSSTAAAKKRHASGKSGRKIGKSSSIAIRGKNAGRAASYRRLSDSYYKNGDFNYKRGAFNYKIATFTTTLLHLIHLLLYYYIIILYCSINNNR